MDIIGSAAWWGAIIGVACGAVGVIQYIKGFFPKELPAWIWRVLLALASAGAGVALAGVVGGGIWVMIIDAAAVLTAGQIGYPVLIKIPEAFIARLSGAANG